MTLIDGGLLGWLAVLISSPFRWLNLFISRRQAPFSYDGAPGLSRQFFCEAVGAAADW
jgi:hypothetical protein